MKVWRFYSLIICIVAGIVMLNSNLVLANENVDLKYGKKISLDKIFGEDVSLGEEKSIVVTVSGDTLSATGVGKTTFAVRTRTGIEILNITVKPQKVSGVNVNRDKTEALLQWTKQKNASYVIYRSTKKNSGYKKVGTLKNSYWADTDYDKVQWVDTKLKSNKKYYYKIKAYCKIDGKKVYGSYSSIKKASKYSKSSTELCYGAMTYINNIRKKEGLRPLLWDYNAEKGAKTRTKEINKKFSHTRPNGKDCMTAYTGVNGYSENIAIGSWSYKVAVEDWMDSPGHRMWLLLGYTEDIQVGGFTIVASESGKEYAPYSVVPGDVCGMVVARKDSSFVFVVTRMIHNSGF